jgi:hypothetical protein
MDEVEILKIKKVWKKKTKSVPGNKAKQESNKR